MLRMDTVLCGSILFWPLEKSLGSMSFWLTRNIERSSCSILLRIFGPSCYCSGLNKTINVTVPYS